MKIWNVMINLWHTATTVNEGTVVAETEGRAKQLACLKYGRRFQRPDYTIWVELIQDEA